MPNDYLFTWKSDRWPYEKLRALIDAFDTGAEVTEPWRCLAHTMVRPGDSAYLLKQGDDPRGIFGVGTLTGPAIKNSAAQLGENPWQVPITFRALVDPTQELLVSEKQLLAMPVPEYRWHPMGSGVSLEQIAARTIDDIISDSASRRLLAPDQASADVFDAQNIKDGREKTNRSITLRRGQREFRASLLSAYGKKCAVTGCDVEDLLEAAHIVPYRGPETNHIQNGLLLRSDIHTLFDCGLLAIDTSRMTIILSSRLLQSSYKKLSNRKIRLPIDASKSPSSEGLTIHRRMSGL